MVGSHAGACVGGVTASACVVADGSGDCAAEVVTAFGTGGDESYCGVVLQGEEVVEEEGCESTPMGLFIVSETGQMEVCEVFEELLL